MKKGYVIEWNFENMKYGSTPMFTYCDSRKRLHSISTFYLVLNSCRHK